MASGQSLSVDAPAHFQFTLRHLLLLMVACSFAFALLFHWGIVGFIVCYALGCLIAIAWGIYTKSSEWCFAGGLALIVGYCMGLPAIRIAPGSARRSTCTANLRSISIALVQYHDDHGSFPPPYIADAKGNPMHSWRVLILPYLDQRGLHKQYRFDEPWDGSNNRQLHDIVLSFFSCPSRPANQPATDTNYVAVVGPKTAFPENGYVRMADFLDGTSNTVLLVEVHDSGIHWLEPRDLHIYQMPMAINPPQGQGISSAHKNGANVAFADGSIRFLPNDTAPKTLRAILTRSGKESLTMP